ncbi:MAG: DNA-directed RNA polymerase subunit alpha [Candidatus Cloacimonetes bacterium]|nr:DNA-directed RNA polymerase subunit alpha [Candidatus Cloacimonadota bacterium]
MMLLEPLQMPDSVTVDDKTLSPTYGKFYIGPLEPGFATTIGNTLRRVLLSSIQGAAVRYVKIEGLHHEFSPIPGSTSDFIDLIQKLKKLVFTMNSLEEVHVTIDVKGPKIVTAADIAENINMTVVNKDLELLELTEDVDFKLDMWVGIGRGYIAANKQNVEDKPIGIIPIDSIYSPIIKVNFQSGHRRVGDRIDYDELIMEITTDGSIDPRSSLFLAAKILKDQYSAIAQFEKEPEYVEEVEMDPELERLDKLFNMSVKELELTVRSANCLAAAKIENIGELVGRNEQEMLKYRNFGKKSLDEIVALLTKYDLTLGMDVEGFKKRIDDAKSRITKIR